MPQNNLKMNRLYSGSILIYAVVIIFIFSIVMVSLLGYAASELRVIRASVNKEQAFQIAEAGVNYYQWHLAHYAADYADGTGQTCNPCGPYVHNYVDKDTNTLIGRYSLTITPPLVGSTVVLIKSIGYTLQNANQQKTISVKYGIPSLAQYAFLTNSDAWIGNTENVSGQFHTNGGLRFDGTGNAPINSAKSTYTCISTFGCSPSATKPGIWGSASQATKNFWNYPVPNVDFSSMTSDLATMKASAQSSGLYLAPSNKQGYSLVFKNNGTVDIYKVTSLANDPTGWDVGGTAHSTSIDYSARSFQSNSAIPANGLIFIEDKVWVEGIVKGRVMVAAAKLPYNVNTAPSIFISDDITYLAKDGTNSLGLIGQQDVLVTYQAPTDLEINAAIIAQNGSAQRYNYPGNIKNSITLYGTLASYGTWTWSWVDGGGNTTSGYANTYTTYDSNLLYSPPPSFPLSSSGYQQINWTSN